MARITEVNHTHHLFDKASFPGNDIVSKSFGR